MSKGLEALEKIKKLNILYDIEMCSNGEEYMKDNDIDLSAIEKELKVLEIICKYHFLKSLFLHSPTYEVYKINMSFFEDEDTMSEEEYNLLKEVLL